MKRTLWCFFFISLLTLSMFEPSLGELEGYAVPHSRGEGTALTRYLEDDSATCVDNTTLLREVLEYAYPGVQVVGSFITCSWIDENRAYLKLGGEAMFGYDIRWLADNVTCESTQKSGDFCATTTDEAAKRACEKFLTPSKTNLTTMEAVCCRTCHPVEDTGASGVRWTINVNNYEDEAESLGSFLVALGALDESDAGELCNFYNSRVDITCQYDRYMVVATNLTGAMDATIGELTSLSYLSLSGGSLTGGIPQEIGNCQALISLLLEDVGLTGTLPSTLKQLVNLELFSVAGNQLSGSIDADFFQHWPTIMSIDISDNQFIGKLPTLNFLNTSELVSVTASFNKFDGINSFVNGDFSVLSSYALSLKLDHNSLTGFPSELKDASRLETLWLNDNQISSLPPWGYFQSNEIAYWAIMGVTDNLEGSVFDCPHYLMSEQSGATELWPPVWTELSIVKLDNNPFGKQYSEEKEDTITWGTFSSLRHQLGFFASAPRLSRLSCANCSLSGNILPSMIFTTQYRLVPRLNETGGATGKCSKLDAYAHLQEINLQGNDVRLHGESCDILVLLDEADGSLGRFECESCPSHSEVSPYAQTPLETNEDCLCKSTFTRLYTEDGVICGCADGYHLDPLTDTCIECLSQLNCEWGSHPEKSLGVPELNPGAWAPCMNANTSFEDHILICGSSDDCPGGELITMDSCSEVDDVDNHLCSLGRTGVACATCEVGYYGASTGTCDKCQVTTEQARLQGSFVILACIPLMVIGMIFLGRTSSMSRFALFRKLKSTFRQLLKHIQVLAVVTNINVGWPRALQPLLEVCSILTLEFDRLVQLGCWAGQQTPGVALAFKWTAPLGVVPMVLAAIPCSIVMSKILGLAPWSIVQRFSSACRQNLASSMTFLYMLWHVYFATLTSQSFLIFTCIEHPNGDFRVSQYPEIICGTENFWTYSIGGLLSVIVYVCGFFLISQYALRHVSDVMKASVFTERGPFEFVTDGLRTSHIHFNVYGAMKDVLLNLAIVCLSHDTTSQMLVSAGILLIWGARILWSRPFDRATSNFIETWSSMGIGFFLILCISFGLGNSSVGDIAAALGERETSQGMWLLTTLIASLGVPIVLMVMEACGEMQMCTCWIPASLRIATEAQVKKEVKAFHQVFQQQRLADCVEVMDFVEWRNFVNALGLWPEIRKMMATMPSNQSFIKKLEDVRLDEEGQGQEDLKGQNQRGEQNQQAGRTSSGLPTPPSSPTAAHGVPIPPSSPTASRGVPTTIPARSTSSLCDQVLSQQRGAMSLTSGHSVLQAGSSACDATSTEMPHRSSSKSMLLQDSELSSVAARAAHRRRHLAASSRSLSNLSGDFGRGASGFGMSAGLSGSTSVLPDAIPDAPQPVIPPQSSDRKSPMPGQQLNQLQQQQLQQQQEEQKQEQQEQHEEENGEVRRADKPRKLSVVAEGQLEIDLTSEPSEQTETGPDSSSSTAAIQVLF